MKSKISFGFSLLELVTMISIIGIISAVAIPRYMDLLSAARVAKVNMLYQNIQTAVSMAHLITASQGGSGNTAATIAGIPITMRNFYPTADTLGIMAAANIDATFSQISLTPIPAVPAAMMIAVNGAADRMSCSITYQEARASRPPAISIATSGC